MRKARRSSWRSSQRRRAKKRRSRKARHRRVRRQPRALRPPRRRPDLQHRRPLLRLIPWLRRHPPSGRRLRHRLPTPRLRRHHRLTRQRRHRLRLHPSRPRRPPCLHLRRPSIPAQRRRPVLRRSGWSASTKDGQARLLRERRRAPHRHRPHRTLPPRRRPVPQRRSGSSASTRVARGPPMPFRRRHPDVPRRHRRLLPTRLRHRSGRAHLVPPRRPLALPRPAGLDGRTRARRRTQRLPPPCRQPRTRRCHPAAHKTHRPRSRRPSVVRPR
jgi:hypothetical protein